MKELPLEKRPCECCAGRYLPHGPTPRSATSPTLLAALRALIQTNKVFISNI